ncbi:hypothetical protein EYR38_004887 [Pleurotus pulmonarius]|nr:hypothetical protein EYR38_004887 [Pleurotus pulmonarius]
MYAKAPQPPGPSASQTASRAVSTMEAAAASRARDARLGAPPSSSSSTSILRIGVGVAQRLARALLRARGHWYSRGHVLVAYSQPNPPSHLPSPANAFPTLSVSARGVVPLVDVDVECALCVHGTLHTDYAQRRTLEGCIRELQVSWLWRWDGGSARGGEIVALGLGLGGGAGGSAPAIRTFASAPAPASAMGG